MTVIPLRQNGRDERGFTLLEVMVATALMLVVCGAIVSALLQMTTLQTTILNRTEMHSGVRGATELLQQEVGQAGRVALPAAVTLTSAVAATGSQTPTVSSATGMFVGMNVVVGGGATEETVTLTAVVTSPASFTAVFTQTHASGESVQALGGFANGIVPSSVTNGSSGTVLKMFGDINGDGNLLYIEYTCDTAAGNLYRNSMAWSAASKPAVGPAQVLLGNILPNPGTPPAPCFTYQTQTVGATTYVTDVTITLTVQTQQVDPITNTKQRETKALLNVSPRNIFNTWELAAAGITVRSQPTPSNITTNLLP